MINRLQDDMLVRLLKGAESPLTVAEIGTGAELTAPRVRAGLKRLEAFGEVRRAGVSSSGAQCWALGGDPVTPTPPGEQPADPGQQLADVVAYLQGRRRDSLRAIRASAAGGSSSDYWRWQGHAELSRQLLDRLNAEVPQ